MGGISTPGGMEIGAVVTSGTATCVLFVDASGNLGQDSTSFTWDDTAKTLTLTQTATNYVTSVTGPVVSGGNPTNLHLSNLMKVGGIGANQTGALIEVGANGSVAANGIEYGLDIRAYAPSGATLSNFTGVNIGVNPSAGTITNFTGIAISPPAVSAAHLAVDFSGLSRIDQIVMGTTSYSNSPLTIAGGSTFARALALDNSWTNGGGASTGTLTNAPVAGNPTWWLEVYIGGNPYQIPCWPG